MNKYAINEISDEIEYLNDASENIKRKKVEIKIKFLFLLYCILFFE